MLVSLSGDYEAALAQGSALGGWPQPLSRFAARELLLYPAIAASEMAGKETKRIL